MQSSNSQPTDCKSTLQLTQLHGKLSCCVRIRTINEKSFSMFISKGSMSHNGGVPFPPK